MKEFLWESSLQMEILCKNAHGNENLKTHLYMKMFFENCVNIFKSRWIVLLKVGLVMGYLAFAQFDNQQAFVLTWK